MNIGSVDPISQAAELLWTENAQSTIGSGTIWYTQAGILLPNKEAKPKIRIPFGAVTYKNFDALTQSSTQFDVGSNFFLDGIMQNNDTVFNETRLYRINK
jgi:hypothetical protein